MLVLPEFSLVCLLILFRCFDVSVRRFVPCNFRNPAFRTRCLLKGFGLGTLSYG